MTADCIADSQGPPIAELQFIVRQFGFILWMDKETFGCLPFAGMSSTVNADHLHLTVDWPAESATGNRQKCVRVDVSESHGEITVPLTGTAYDFPVVSGIADTLLAVARDLLFAGQWTLEVVRVEEASGGLVLETNAFAALDDGSEMINKRVFVNANVYQTIMLNKQPIYKKKDTTYLVVTLDRTFKSHLENVSETFKSSNQIIDRFDN